MIKKILDTNWTIQRNPEEFILKLILQESENLFRNGIYNVRNLPKRYTGGMLGYSSAHVYFQTYYAMTNSLWQVLSTLEEKDESKIQRPENRKSEFWKWFGKFLTRLYTFSTVSNGISKVNWNKFFY